MLAAASALRAESLRSQADLVLLKLISLEQLKRLVVRFCPRSNRDHYHPSDVTYDRKCRQNPIFVYIPAHGAISVTPKKNAPAPSAPSKTTRNVSPVPCSTAVRSPLAVDIHVDVPRVPFEKLSSQRIGETSAKVRERVERARAIADLAGSEHIQTAHRAKPPLGLPK